MGSEAVASMCREVDSWAARVGKSKRSDIVPYETDLDAQILSTVGEELEAAYRGVAGMLVWRHPHARP